MFSGQPCVIKQKVKIEVKYITDILNFEGDHSGFVKSKLCSNERVATAK